MICIWLNVAAFILFVLLCSAHVYEVQSQFHGDNTHMQTLTYLILTDIFHKYNFYIILFATNSHENYVFSLSQKKKRMSKCVFV